MPNWQLRLIGALVAACFLQAEPSWWYRAGEGRAGPYRIRTDLPGDEARALARHLNVMHAEFSRRLAALPRRGPAPLSVLIFRDELDYLGVLQERFGIDAAGTGGMFFVEAGDSALALYVGGLPPRRVEHVLQHEGFHQFAWSRFGGDLPPWVDEGLAELFGEAIVAGRNVLVGEARARVVERVRAAVESDAQVPFRDLLNMTDERWAQAVEEGAASLLYDQSWSMVHFLVYGDEGRYAGRFEHYLKLIAAGNRADAAFIRAFEAADVDAFERRWKAYALAMEPTGLATAMERIAFLAEGALALSRDGVIPETLGELREALQAGGFTRAVAGSHGVELRQRAGDEMFEIPFAGNADLEQAPEFVVTKFRPRSRRQRHLETLAPTPPAIETRWLKPWDLAVEWARDPETGKLSYDVKAAGR